ncbi:MAG: ABC transporter permease [Rhodospirillaceae bacterium]|nr:ABC transporter permease [Rhodospirillaceae bacterium]
MSQVAFLGAVEVGLVYALVAIGVFLSFRVLSFPDLTVDGSFPLGAAVAATLIVAGWNPYLATAAATASGAAAGLVTAFLNIRLRILHLLASILTMIALFSVNLRIMGRPNIALLQEDTVLTPFLGGTMSQYEVKPLFLAVIVVVAALLVAGFLASQLGLAMRATGANARMARAQGIDPGRQIFLGMAIANGLVGLAGALFAQTNGFADVTSGVGTIIIGLAAVILGETLMRGRSTLVMVGACVVGSILYRIAVQAALEIDALGLKASDMNLVTAVLVTVALVLPGLGSPVTALLRRGGR